MHSLAKIFTDQSRVVRIILLLIPFVNWFFEVVVRLDSALRSKDPVKIAFAVIVCVFGLAVGWLDVVWTLLFGHLVLE